MDGTLFSQRMPEWLKLHPVADQCTRYEINTCVSWSGTTNMADWGWVYIRKCKETTRIYVQINDNVFTTKGYEWQRQ